MNPIHIAQRQPLGRNHGRYLGESIIIDEVLNADLEAARRFGWHAETICETHAGPVLAFCHSVDAPKRKVYLSTGIHGDEPAGPLVIRQLLMRNEWPPDASVWLCPCLNPSGFPFNQRSNSEGMDLNRDYLHLETREVSAHVLWLRKQPDFDVALCLHEDWEAVGFYLYELNPEGRPSWAEAIIAAVSSECPIDESSLIEGRLARNGIIRPDTDPTSRPRWPEAFFLIHHRTRLSYTLEAPSDFPLATRVAALITAVKVILFQ